MALASPELFAFVGCRTTSERKALGKGITVFTFDEATFNWTEIQCVENLVNPSYLITNTSRRCLYVAHGDTSTVSAFRIDPESGKIVFVNQEDTRGINPVHLAQSRDHRRLMIANYATGSVASLPLSDDGSLGEVDTLITLPGTPGPNRFEQKGSHPHEIRIDPTHRFLVVPDKGLDRIFIIAIDEAERPLADSLSWIDTRKGAGPRHIVFNREATFCYVVNELDSSVTTYAWEARAGSLNPLQVTPTIPEHFTGNNTASEIELSACGKYLYVSNRGHNSICRFSVASDTGKLSSISWTSAAGQGPRFFTLTPSGRWLIAANEISSNLATFSVAPKTGHLKFNGQSISSGSPTCISWFVSRK